MECVPMCVTCTGLCKRAGNGTRPNTPAPSRAASNHRGGAGYILMTCLHFTTREEQLAFKSIYGVKSKRKYWCPTCDTWKNGEKLTGEAATEAGLF